MSTYLQIVNDAGSVIVDDNTPWLCVTRHLLLSAIGVYNTYSNLAQGDSGAPSDRMITSCNSYMITLNSGESLVGFRADPGQEGVIISGHPLSSTQYVITVAVVTGHTLDASKIHVYVYGTCTADTEHGCGIVAYNAAGKCVFSSQQQLLDVVGTYKTRYAPGGASDGSSKPWSSITNTFALRGADSNVAVIMNNTVADWLSQKNSNGQVVTYGLEFGASSTILKAYAVGTYQHRDVPSILPWLNLFFDLIFVNVGGEQ